MTDAGTGGAPAERTSLGFGALIAPRPSLDWTLAKLTGTWATSGEMISCPLPGHDDSTPSFNLWMDDDEGVPQRFGCFGCGRNGDVVDLIAEIEDVGPQKALERAAQLYDEEQQDESERKRVPKEKKEPERPLSEVHQEILENMGPREFDVLQRFMESKGLEGEELLQFAVDQWEWAARERVVTFVHRALGNDVTGIKCRSGSRRWTEDGSHFTELYGAWRDQRRPNVLVCEGESDTLWGSWSLRDDPEWDVMGLPSGAHQRVQHQWIEALEGRTVTIAFDGDDEGMRAAQKWCQAMPNTLVARVPEGEDLLSCGIPVKELLDHAAVPMRATGMIVVAGGVFAKHSQNGDAPIADFSFEPRRELITEEGPAWEGLISGRRDEVLLRAADLHSASSITKWANRHGRSWIGGSGPAVQGVFNYLKATSSFLPLERATTKAGKIGRSFVGPGFCIGPDRIRYVPPAFGDAQLASKLHVEPGPWDPTAVQALEKLNDPGVMAIIIGWLCATLLRGQRAPAPPLFVSGESGAGKTNMLSIVLSAFGFGTETNLTTTTPYGVDSMVSSCVGFPVWFDEYRGGARIDSMERLRQLLRDAYYGQPSLKGGMKAQATELTEVTTWAGIVVSGEMSSGETSHRDRIVMLDLDRGARNKRAYAWLNEDKRRTAGLGEALLQFLAKRPDVLFKIRPFGSPDLPDRFRETLGFVQTGWEAWKHFRWEIGLRDAPTEPDLRGLAGERGRTEDPWVEAIKACVGVTDRNGNPVVSEEDGAVLLIPAEVIVEAKRIGIELPARANELVAWLRKRYEVEDVRLMGGRRAKRIKGMVL